MCIIVNIKNVEYYSVFTEIEGFVSTSRMSISQTPCCVRGSQRQSRSRLLSYRAIVRGRFDKLPNNCQMLQNDEIESDFGAATSKST